MKVTQTKTRGLMKISWTAASTTLSRLWSVRWAHWYLHGTDKGVA